MHSPIRRAGNSIDFHLLSDSNCTMEIGDSSSSFFEIKSTFFKKKIWFALIYDVQ